MMSFLCTSYDVCSCYDVTDVVHKQYIQVSQCYDVCSAPATLSLMARDLFASKIREKFSHPVGALLNVIFF